MNTQAKLNRIVLIWTRSYVFLFLSLSLDICLFKIRLRRSSAIKNNRSTPLTSRVQVVCLLMSNRMYVWIKRGLAFMQSAECISSFALETKRSLWSTHSVRWSRQDDAWTCLMNKCISEFRRLFFLVKRVTTQMTMINHRRQHLTITYSNVVSFQ